MTDVPMIRIPDDIVFYFWDGARFSPVKHGDHGRDASILPSAPGPDEDEAEFKAATAGAAREIRGACYDFIGDGDLSPQFRPLPQAGSEQGFEPFVRTFGTVLLRLKALWSLVRATVSRNPRDGQ